MSDLRQAAEMALEELEAQVEHHSGAYLAIDALRQALSQDHGFDRTASHMAGEYVDTAEPNRDWLDLTDAEISQAVGSSLNEVYLTYFRKVIAKVKEKNR